MTSAVHAFAATKIIRNKGIGKERADPLPRLLDQLIARAAGPATVEQASSRPWASALFDGRAAAFAQDIGEAEWSLSGHFVADISVDRSQPDAQGVTLDLSALTIQDW
ncbi:hypothetical protein [Sphingobium sp. CCH11-B1]|jgi:hypothetical protein|uniref:hypothetical protein n=1 Tax=Sphingobium sp. CCH11-B1 TaxID=1768781 RepID=UPI000834779F|nr:hypothetical protein [Sphingobium sp. CCH11-B1]MEA3388234.1 hypothetical protein [Pseudomonadota bacterium]